MQKKCVKFLQLEHRVLRYQVEMQAVQQYQGTQGSSSAVSEAKLLRQPRKSVHQVEVEGQSVSTMLCVELRYLTPGIDAPCSRMRIWALGARQGGDLLLFRLLRLIKYIWPSADEQTCVVSRCISLAMYLSTRVVHGMEAAVGTNSSPATNFTKSTKER